MLGEPTGEDPRTPWRWRDFLKLAFNRIGTKFFFVTVAVEGRRAVLSRLVDEKSRPVLSGCGELVRAGLRALHLVRPAVGVSDYVIMPDHFHFLLLVDCSRDAIISPLWLTHRLIDALERAAGKLGGTDGGNPPHPLAEGGGFGSGEVSPETMARYLAEACAAADFARGLAPDPGVRGQAPVASPLRFERSPYLELSFDSRQLKTIRRYIRLNPARAIWKQRNPDLFVRHTNLRHPYLDARQSWSSIGYAPLFASPFLFHVRLTLKKSVEEHRAAIAEIVEKARRGYIAVSGFLSPGEKEAFRQLKEEPRARFIKLLPASLPPRYDPSAEDSREIAAGRLLILSGFSNTPALSALEMRKNPAVAHQFRLNCLAMNDLAAALCRAAEEGLTK